MVVNKWIIFSANPWWKVSNPKTEVIKLVASEVFNILKESDDERYSKLLYEWKYTTVAELCISKIADEINLEKEKHNKVSEISFYNISTPGAIKWRQRLEEIADIVFENFLKKQDYSCAYDFCTLKINTTIHSERERLTELWESTKAEKVNFNNISTAEALKWKQRLNEVEAKI